MGRAIFVTLLRRLELTLRTKFTPRVLICMYASIHTVEPLWNKVLCITVFFAPVIVKYMEKNLDIMKPQCMEEIFSVPQPFVISRFHFSRRTEGFEILLFYNTNCKLVVAALTSKKAYILYLCHKDPPIVAIYILTAPRGECLNHSTL